MKRYSTATVEKVKAMIAKGMTTDEISKKTKVKPFSVAYYRKLTPGKTKTKNKTIRQLHALVKSFLGDLEQMNLT